MRTFISKSISALNLIVSGRDIMRDNMIINVSGLKGHSMAVDLNIEHLIGYLKALHAAKGKGLHSTWDRLGDISAGVFHLQNIKKQVARALSSAYGGSTHKTPDTSNIAWSVVQKVSEYDLMIFKLNREGNRQAKKSVNTLLTGEQGIKTTTLMNFNKMVREMAVSGDCADDEEDELPPLALLTEYNSDNNSLENNDDD